MDRTENLFWQIMWLQDELLKMTGESWDGPSKYCVTINF